MQAIELPIALQLPFPFTALAMPPGIEAAGQRMPYSQRGFLSRAGGSCFLIAPEPNVASIGSGIALQQARYFAGCSPQYFHCDQCVVWIRMKSHMTLIYRYEIKFARVCI
ncbi:MAG: hypothetical protein ACYDC8_17710 [Gammaproteobacteria bacterium]